MSGSTAVLTPDEMDFVRELRGRGHTVEIVVAGTRRTPDFSIDGVWTELKTLSGVVNQTANDRSAASRTAS